MTSNLLPCPHCGSNEVEYRRARDNPRAWVLCGNCGAMCDELDTLPEADCVTAWNRRAGETIREMAKLYAYSPTTGRGYIELEAEPQPASPAPEAMARRFHEAYERLAPTFGYETRAETRDFNPHSPNGKLMIAVCASIAQPAAPEAIEDMCARIKAADDAAADGDYMLDSKDCISVLRGTWKGPLAMDMPAKPSTVEQAINTLVTALAASKGWMRDYADAIIRDAIDRRVPEAMTHAEIMHIWDTRVGDPSSGYPLTDSDKIEFARAILYHRLTANGAEAWKDVPRTGDWVADAGGETK